MRLHAERARPGAARAVRGREGLVDVDVDAVEAEVAGPRDAEERVHVRAVAVHERAYRVHRIAHLAHALLEEADRVRVREHEARDVRTERALQRLEVDVATGVALHRRHFVAAHRGRRGVRAVRGVGHDDAPPRRGVPALLVIGLEHQERGELGLRAGLGLQRHEIHTGDLQEHLLELVGEREHALCRPI